MEGILNLENWRKFGNDWVGYYIYPIASKVAYEIVINFHYLDTPILTAKGTLSIVGLWNNKDKSVSLEREYLAKDMKNIINKIKEYIYMYIKYVPYNNNPKYYKDSVNCSIFYIPINKIITKWLINNICYYLHINKNKNIHLRIYK